MFLGPCPVVIAMFVAVAVVLPRVLLLVVVAVAVLGQEGAARPVLVTLDLTMKGL